jgi:hypothetical protein
MSGQPEKVRDLQYSFSSFLWHNLMKIQENWDAGDIVHALSEAVSLRTYLPIPVKDELKALADEITEKLNKSFETSASDFHSSMLVKHRESRRVAQLYLKRYIDKMMTCLDKRGYLERGSYTPITKEDFSNLEGEKE